MIIEPNSKIGLELQEELKVAHILVNHCRDAVFCVGKDGNFLYMNDATCSLVGYSREEMRSLGLRDIDAYWEKGKWLQQWQRLRQQGSVSFETCYRDKAGEILDVNLTLVLEKLESKQICCVYAYKVTEEQQNSELQQPKSASPDIRNGLEQEIVEYQKTDDDLKSSLSLLSNTLESTANGILAINFDGEILYYNQKFMDLWHLPPEIRLSRNCSKAKGFFESQIEDVEVFRSHIWELPAKSDSETYNLLKLKDGRIFAHYSEPYVLNGDIIGRVWSIWDITESRRTEEALKRNEARFRTLAQNTEAGIILVHDDYVCYANRAAEILTGYSVKELTRNNFKFEQLIQTRQHRQVRKQDGAPTCQYEEMQIRTKQGFSRWLACTLERLDGVLDFAGKEVQMITAIDITDYKLAESELRQALEQARRLSELRQRFVSMLCHQFRTPLNVVSFSSDLLRRNIHQWSQEKNQSYLDLIQDAVEQISELLDEILLFGKAEADTLKCEPRQLDVKQYCRDIVAQIYLAGGKQKAVNFQSKGECSTRSVDPKLLHHILTNLLSNAIKYSVGSNPVTLELICREEDVIFNIIDRGIGIPAVDQQQIFEPFYRGSNIDSIPGTGLGLSIVKTLADIHGCEISLLSEVGAGTTFTLKVPSSKD
ncbi:PAS domain S-box [Rivularia sp. PCC 7116]|uniref:scytonemin biosynthesis sensor histidine kinase n=1 Tax=Rivularia sp. PCC 7116 TaxID=373994 RepID=UPI00029EEB82|nr:scytonemin biosynthesis sensor histidine kinase [Rivularia sp. PCC 7116]AFY54442.1 PAS domain S-box [Rivularia sp. PCC 7116]